MNCRGIRGAIGVEANTHDAIVSATRELLKCIVVANRLSVEDVASAIFTATTDLDAAYPAQAARAMGWVNTPLLCMQEMAVQGSLRRCIRVLMHWNTDKSVDEIQHVFLGKAQKLRPDLANKRNQMEEKEIWQE